MKSKFMHSNWICLALFLIMLPACKLPSTEKSKTTNFQAAQKSAQPPKSEFRYGIDVSKFTLETGTVMDGENLVSILGRFQVPNSSAFAAAAAADSVFDVRSIKAGNSYCLFQGTESCVRYFVYEENPVNYVVFDLGDPIRAYTGEKPVEVRIQTASGIIENSLYQTVMDQGLSYDLLIKLSEIYAWSVDFHHLQKGDGFTAVFEQNYVDENPVGLGKVLAARFSYTGSDFNAFYFQTDNQGDYYDEKGQCLRKAFLKAPIRYSRISSGFSHRRLHPVLKVYRPHLGTDYAAPAGTPVMSVGDGVVAEAAYNSSSGRYLKIRHNNVYSTQYLHFSRFAKGIRAGVRVRQGQIIGYVGSTGLATGPHLDFRLCKNGKPVDHRKEKMPLIQPLNNRLLPLFVRHIEPLKLRLDEASICADFANDCASEKVADLLTQYEYGSGEEKQPLYPQ
ncbi:MAG: M23 family metallopeptidase [Desulfobacterales bacterium]|jgi:murein DD-endopeptidase MepM/ murein hydrolase activator NlpD|nr:M23 family metallopeptidase [Desulfobacterales bacterium]